MSPTTQDELMHALATELGAMNEASAARLSSILRGLFACMQDLNERLAVLESQAARTANGEN
jgi:predicted ATP-binding protein involved in virulence